MLTKVGFFFLYFPWSQGGFVLDKLIWGVRLHNSLDSSGLGVGIRLGGWLAATGLGQSERDGVREGATNGTREPLMTFDCLFPHTVVFPY